MTWVQKRWQKVLAMRGRVGSEEATETLY